MSNCNSCGGSFNPLGREYHIGPECWHGKCHECALRQPEYAVHLEAELAAAKAGLAEAMRVRHYCCIEGSEYLTAKDGDVPYKTDQYLQRWERLVGRRVYSDWPTPGRERAVTPEPTQGEGK